ncbi:LRP2-binding protein-like [Orbicella faveolata]|uniref:LRP2-binding protein-like n=1 Tax=Orbicella faveolata TaxID=48498 RepID=UPI0009E5AFF9|nr:LRP2-binding protein-like [Orbicella faveolata]
MATVIAQLTSKMADEEALEIRPFSCPVGPLSDRKLSAEKLPNTRPFSMGAVQEGDEEELSEELLEEILIERSKGGDSLAKFQLGQFYFEREIYDKALVAFERIKSTDFQAKYQLGVMYYDGIGTNANPVKGFEHLKEIAESANPDAAHLIPFAQYNVGRAYYEGFGVKQSDKEAERWLLAAAQDGEPSGSIKAQTVLGLFYSRPDEESFDLQKAYFWHQEATGNGSLESQGALGVMFEYGIGVRRDGEAAFKCLKEAAARGNVYAQGNLAVHYYRRKLLNKAADVAKSVGEQEDIQGLALETDCLPRYVAKGIALGCFVYGRCLHHGLGVEQNREQAKHWYSRVGVLVC